MGNKAIYLFLGSLAPERKILLQQDSVTRRLPQVRMAGFFMHNGWHSRKICSHPHSSSRSRTWKHFSVFKTHCSSVKAAQSSGDKNPVCRPHHPQLFPCISTPSKCHYLFFNCCFQIHVQIETQPAESL